MPLDVSKTDACFELHVFDRMSAFRSVQLSNVCNEVCER